MAEDVHAKIEAANRIFGDGFERGDAVAIAALYTKDAALFPANSDIVRGGGNIRDFWQAVIGMGIKNAVLQTIEVEQHGDTAIEVGKYRLLAEGGAQADAGKYVVVWKNDQGTWKLHRDIWNTSQPAK